MKSLAAKSPQNKLQSKTKMALGKSPHNFKGILEAQDYEIKRRDGAMIDEKMRKVNGKGEGEK